MLEKIEGIVLRTQDYGESHKLITIFSKNIGKFTAIARGAKKPKSRMASVTQPFIEGQFLTYISRGLSTIQQAEIENSHRNIREDIVKTIYASYIGEMTTQVLEEKAQELYIYDQFIRTLEWIEIEADPRIPVMMYELKLFQKAGFAPIVTGCANCGTKENLSGFSIGEGGLICTQCRHRDPHSVSLPPNVLRLFPLFLQVGLEQVGTISLKEESITLLRQILDAYYDYYGGYQLKSRKLLKSIHLLE